MSEKLEVTYRKVAHGVDGMAACWVAPADELTLERFESTTVTLDKAAALSAMGIETGKLVFYSGGQVGNLLCNPCVTQVTPDIAALNHITATAIAETVELSKYSPFGVIVSDTPYEE